MNDLAFFNGTLGRLMVLQEQQIMRFVKVITSFESGLNTIA
jgi:hypothetical protein